MSTLPTASYNPQRDWTHTPEPPPVDPQLHLTPRSPVSFVVNSIEGLVAWLQRASWHELPGRSPSEHSRLVRGRRLVVLYHTGTVLVQGPYPEETIAELRGCCQ